MRIIDKKAKYELENQVIAKMFREDKRFRTRVIPNKKKEYKNEDYAKRQQKQWEKKGYKVTRRKNVLYLKKG